MTAISEPTCVIGHPERRPPLVQIAVDMDPRGQTDGAAAATNSQMGDPLAERLAYSVAEAAFITGLSRDLLYDQMRSGDLLYLKVGRRRIITRRDLEAFLGRAAS